MTPESSSTPALLERDSELEAIDRAVARALDGSGGLLVIDGPAGVGKSALIDAARGRATRAGFVLLTARGAEMERAFGFGVVRQLFDGVVRDSATPPDTLFAGA